MPFLITAKRTVITLDFPKVPAEAVTVSRRAVVTLEEAHETAREACLLAPGDLPAIAQCVRDVFALTESGGTVSLPDGTTIEVEPVDWLTLAELASVKLATYPRLAIDRSKGQIIAAYNAAQERLP